MVRRVAGRYVLGAQLGAGGTSRVHAALDERLGRQVAVKLLDAGLARSADPAGRERFLREGPTSASFSHPNVVTVFDAGEDDGELYIVMELVEGWSLATHLARNGPLSTEEATRIARQVLAALSAAHAAGIVHRDVKPANVLLGADGDVKLADFGIATRFDELLQSVTTTGLVIGTPRYLAPERLMGAPATPTADVYAVGVMLFEMLAGRPPFTGDSPGAIASVQRTSGAPDVRELRPDVPAPLAGVVARALSTDPADRYESALDMSTDLAGAWSPPSPPPAEADVPTVVMGVAPAAMMGIRSGDTAVMPATGVPSRPVRPARVARAVTAPVAPAPAPALAPIPVPLAVPDTDGAPRSNRWLIAVAVLMVIGLGVAGVLAARDSGTSLFTGTSTTVTPSTSSPTTERSTTTSTDSTSTTLADLIPGFPDTTSLPVFLQQLKDTGFLVGTAGKTLATQLEAVLNQKSPKKRRDAATRLRSEIVQWMNDGSLDPTVGAALNDLLAAI